MDLIDQFKALDDKSIVKQFDQLTLNDLCAASETCLKLLELAEKCFLQNYAKFTSKPVIILCTKDGIEFDEIGQQCFGRYIQSVKIKIIDRMPEKLAEFMLLKIGKNLRKIQFVSAIMNPSFTELIESILVNVEGISVRYNDVYIIRYSTQLKYLKLYGFPVFTEMLKCIELKTLEVLDLEVTICDEFNCIGEMLQNLKILLQQNSNVKRLICRLHIDNIELLKKFLLIVATTENIEEFLLEILEADLDFAHVVEEFDMLTARKSFQRFEIKLNCDMKLNIKNFSKLSPLSKLSGLLLPLSNHLHVVDASVVRNFSNLKVLQIDPMHFNKEYTVLALRLTNLRKLYCAYSSECEQNNIVVRMSDFISPFVRYSTKLKKIILAFAKISGNERQTIAQMNQERRKLENAQKLTIYVDEAQNDLQESMGNHLVNVKLCKFETNTDLNMEYPNPLIDLIYDGVFN